MTTSAETPENTHLSRSLIKTLVPIFVILGIVVGGLALVKWRMQSGSPAQTAVGSTAEGAKELAVGGQVPDFGIQPFSSADTKAFSSLGGKVSLINFWATWCEACMVEMPSLVKLQGAYRDKGFNFVAINVDEKPDAVLPATLKRLGIRFPVYVDPNGKAADLFDVRAIPLSVVIDDQRHILMIENGERDWFGADFRAQLEKWLAAAG